MNVGELAQRGNVTVRTLHHYDAIGLLPADKDVNGYRTYGPETLERLLVIRGWRELGLPLEQIADLLTGSDPTAALAAHRQLLTEQIDDLTTKRDRLTELLEGRPMHVWNDEAHDRWGDTPQWEQHQRKTAAYGPDDWRALHAEERDLRLRMAAAMRAGEDGTVLALEHRAFLTRWFYDCTPEVHRGLGEMYVADDRFRRHWDSVEPGLAQWLADAIAAAG